MGRQEQDHGALPAPQWRRFCVSKQGGVLQRGFPATSMAVLKLVGFCPISMGIVSAMPTHNLHEMQPAHVLCSVALAGDVH